MENTSLALPVREVEQTNKQMMVLQEQANGLLIKNPEDVEVAATLLETIKGAEKTIVGRKEEITRPLMRSLASVRDLFKPIELTLENAKKIVKAKVIAYQTIEEERIENERAKIMARAEKGTLRTDTAVKKLGEVGEVVKKSGKMNTRMITKIRIIDLSMVPREFLDPNMTRIAEAVLREGIIVPGVETYEEKIIAV